MCYKLKDILATLNHEIKIKFLIYSNVAEKNSYVNRNADTQVHCGTIHYKKNPTGTNLSIHQGDND